jgi:hypothetical protein
MAITRQKTRYDKAEAVQMRLFSMVLFAGYLGVAVLAAGV